VQSASILIILELGGAIKNESSPQKEKKESKNGNDLETRKGSVSENPFEVHRSGYRSVKESHKPVGYSEKRSENERPVKNGSILVPVAKLTAAGPEKIDTRQDPVERSVGAEVMDGRHGQKWNSLDEAG